MIFFSQLNSNTILKKKNHEKVRKYRYTLDTQLSEHVKWIINNYNDIVEFTRLSRLKKKKKTMTRNFKIKILLCSFNSNNCSGSILDAVVGTN